MRPKRQVETTDSESRENRLVGVREGLTWDVILVNGFICKIHENGILLNVLNASICVSSLNLNAYQFYHASIYQPKSSIHLKSFEITFVLPLCTSNFQSKTKNLWFLFIFITTDDLLIRNVIS